MARVDILMIVNVARAVRQNTLNGNLWMVDTNRNDMSQDQATSELVTACQNADTLVWSVTPIDTDLTVSITNIVGNAAKSGVINPQQQVGGAWASKVNGVTHSDYKQAGQYTVNLLVNGTPLSFDPYIDSTAVTVR